MKICPRCGSPVDLGYVDTHASFHILIDSLADVTSKFSHRVSVASDIYKEAAANRFVEGNSLVFEDQGSPINVTGDINKGGLEI